MINKAAGICLLITMLILSACTNGEDPAPSQVEATNSPAKVDTVGEEPPITTITEDRVNSCQFTLDKDLLKTGEQGQLKDLKVDLASSKSELEEAYGEPDEIGFENAEYLKYDNCIFYIWDQDKIGVIDILIHSSVEQVKEVLGKPDFEGLSDAGYAEYELNYKTGEYYLYFSYEDKESTEGILRLKGI